MGTQCHQPVPKDSPAYVVLCAALIKYISGFDTVPLSADKRTVTKLLSSGTIGGREGCSDSPVDVLMEAKRAKKKRF